MKIRPAVRAWVISTGTATLGVVLGAAALLVLRPATFYASVTPIIVVDDVLKPADLIFVLNGRIDTRVEMAARVYRQNLASRVLLTHTREMSQRPRMPLSALIASEIVRRGVPERAVAIIPFPGGVVNTRDEARALREYVEDNPVNRIIVVTTDHHTGRARRTLQLELRGLDVELLMAAAPDGRGIRPDNWWQAEPGRRIYGTELIKQIGAVVLHVARIG